MDKFLTVYGHVAVDVILFPSCISTLADYHVSLGGTGSNIALGTSQFGVPVALCSCIGNNFPREFRQILNDSGVNIDELMEKDEKTSLVAIINKEIGADSLMYRAPYGSLTKNDDLLISNAVKSEYTHFSTGSPEYHLAIMEKIKGQTIIVFDASKDLILWEKEDLKRAIAISEIVFCNAEEEKIILEKLNVNSPLELEVDLFVSTKDSEGSCAYFENKKVNIPMFTVVASDSTGAGDAYRSGFYAARFKKYSLIDSLVIGASLASFCVERKGTSIKGISWDQVLERAKHHLNGNGV